MEKSCLAEIVAITLVLIFSLQVQGRADQTLVYGCSNYTFHMASETTRVNWEESKQLCNEAGGDLVSIQSKEEWIVLKNAIQNWTANEYLIGLKKDKHSGRWIWLSNNSSMNTSRGKRPWAPTQPSGDGECAEMLKDYNKYYGLFNDLPCTAARGGYICEGPVRCIDRKALDPCCPCSSNPCHNGGSCHDNGDRTYSCSCRSGFTGANCKQALDPCSSSPCQNGGSCENKGDGTYGCLCQSGFTGGNCQKLDCSAQPCKNGGTCVDLAERPICKCSSEFTGRLCQGKTPRITQDPKDAVRMAGGKVTFCCEAEGEPAPTFSWLHNEVPMKNQVSKTLHLTSLSAIAADGLYKCRATNEYGKAVSSEAKLTVITGARADSCDPTPLSKVVSLPPGCTEDSSKSRTVNVGTCSYDDCFKRGQGDSGSCGGVEDKTRRCCSPISQPVNSPVSCDNGIKFNVEKVRGCRCSLCAVPDIVVRGRVVDEDGNALLMGEIAVQGDKKKHFTDLSGYFRFTVKSGTKRLVLNFKDPFGNLQETTKALDLHAGQVSFYTIVLQKKPPPIKFAATQKQKIPLSAPSKPDFAAVDIPEKAFVTADGIVYEGEITAKIAVIDPRTEEDVDAAPGDFSAVDDNGEEVMLGTAGMLRQSFTDSSGKELNLDRNITFRIDADMVDVPDGVPVYQYYLSEETGRWVKFGVFRTEVEEVQQGVGRTKRQTRRKFFVGDITPNVPYRSINCDYPQPISVVRVLAPAGAVVTRIGLSNNGQSFTNYHQETVPSNGMLCMRSPRDMPTIMQAELDGAPMVPQQPNNFPPALNPQLISRNSRSSPIQSFRFTCSADGSSGPVYAYQERNRCQQRVAGDLAFVFQQAGQAATFQWQNSRINDPRSPRFWSALFPNFCFIKALVTVSSSDTVIYVKSTGKAPGQRQLDYGYTAEKSTRLRVGNEGVACLEYRCNGGSPAYQTHLQIITLTGRCEIIGLNDVLQRAQGSCTVPPDADSSQENNFCIPDLNGGAAGLYRGNQGLARFRCLTGDNNYNGGRPNPTNVNPTVRLTCN